MPNLKIALCISGHLRTINQCFANLEKYLLNLPNLEIYIFISTWNKWGSNNIHDKSIVDQSNSIEEYIVNKFKFYNLIKYNIEKEREYFLSDLIAQKRDNSDRNTSLLGMHFQIKDCNQLKKDYEREHNFKFDVVIRWRPDLLLLKPLEITLDKDYLNYLYIPTNGDFSLKKNGINDQVMYSSSYNSDLYSSLYHKIEIYLQRGCRFNPEELLFYHLKKHNLQVKRTDDQYLIARPDGNLQNNREYELAIGLL